MIDDRYSVDDVLAMRHVVLRRVRRLDERVMAIPPGTPACEMAVKEREALLWLLEREKTFHLLRVEVANRRGEGLAR